MTDERPQHSTEHSTRRIDRRDFVRLSAATTVGASLLGEVAAETGGEFTKTDPVEIESFDGTTIVCSLYEPTDAEPNPAVVRTHGWGGDRHSAAVRRTAKTYARNGYVVLTYDSRGFGESGGEVGVDGPNEVGDVSALLTWLANRDSVATVGPDDPRVGMDGLSYAGGIQLNAAAVDDRIDAIVPRWAWHDLAYSLAPDDVIKEGWLSLLSAVGVTGSRGVSSGDGVPGLEDLKHGVDPRLHEWHTEATATNRLPDDAREFYRERSAVTKLDAIDVPTLLLHGWPDTLFTPNEAIWTMQALRDRDVDARLVLFDGGHSFSRTADDAQVSFLDGAALDWMETHVRGRAGTSTLAPVTFYETQTGEWRSTESLPPKTAERVDFGLADAALGESTPVANSVAPTSTSHVLEPDVETAGTSATFEFPVEEAADVVGAPELTLHLTPVGPETRLFAKLYHVGTDGSAELVNDQVTPFRVESTPTEPTAVQTVDVELVSFQRFFDPGDALRLVIATTDAGFYGSRESAGVVLYHSERHPSTLTVPANR